MNQQMELENKKRRKKNNRLFMIVAAIGIAVFSLSAYQGTKENKAKDFESEEYAEYYIDKMEAYLEREEDLIEKYLIYVQSDAPGDAREKALSELQALEYQKYNFFRQNYIPPRGFALFQADSYNQTLFGYKSINGILEHRYDEDKHDYQESEEQFEYFLDQAPKLKNRFEEAASVYVISKKNKEKVPLDELEEELENNSKK